MEERMEDKHVKVYGTDVMICQDSNTGEVYWDLYRGDGLGHERRSIAEMLAVLAEEHQRQVRWAKQFAAELETEWVAEATNRIVELQAGIERLTKEDN